MQFIRNIFAAVVAFALLGAAPSHAQVPGAVQPLLLSTCAQPGNDSFTKILLHFTGVAGSQTLTDTNAGGTAKTWTVSSAPNATGPNTVLTSSNFKFGPTALSLPFVANTNPIETPYSTDFNFGTQDWTIDFWYNANGTTPTVRGFTGNGTEANVAQIGIMLFTDNTGRIGSYIGNGTTYTNGPSGSTSLSGTTSWYHIAFVRNGANVMLFVNGVQEGSTVNIGAGWSIPNLTGFPWRIAIVGNAASPTHSIAYGIYDEYRLSVGIARWTTNFPPPTGPYC